MSEVEKRDDPGAEGLYPAVGPNPADVVRRKATVLTAVGLMLAVLGTFVGFMDLAGRVNPVAGIAGIALVLAGGSCGFAAVIKMWVAGK